MANLYQLTPAGEQTLREILTEEMEASVREIAPYLAAGVEKADYSQVGPKLSAIWDRRDTRMAEILDAKQLEEYTDAQKPWRQIFDEAFVEFERKRLAQR